MPVYAVTQLLLLGAIFISGYLTIITWRNQNAPRAVSLWFTRLLFALSVWTLAYMLELAENALVELQIHRCGGDARGLGDLRCL
jgi:hypothetical protein